MTTKYTQKLREAHQRFRNKIHHLRDQDGDDPGLRLRNTWNEQTDGVNMRTVEGEIHDRTIVLVEMQPGATLGRNTFLEDQDIYVITGACQIWSAECQAQLQSGGYARIEGGAEHKIKADESSVLLLVR